MNLTIVRQHYTTKSTMGELLIDGVFECYTLEPAQSSDELVPVGTYDASLQLSPRFKTLTPHLRGVPGYDDEGPHGPIEIHWGNYPNNTEGCCLVGQIQIIEEDFVGRSREALSNLVAKLPTGLPFTVGYVEAVKLVSDIDIGM